ncbi:hypothetical protein RFI_06486 [Reticulomyxa filosa]|uniref:Uncharacterized protein n=1 Tax=Reticulomyxa filosa TaxID=46433 RepID=X6NX96_RETFI|nr:hypothetical protein RFI_06486 [Reticulomyxa filosa]|eukprot:ETO30636.1 hypothetical protein RFI_06486 [Reticulomyxa filosa]
MQVDMIGSVLNLVIDFADYWYGLIHLQLAHHMDIPLHSLFVFNPPLSKRMLEGDLFQTPKHIESVVNYKNVIQKEIDFNFRQYILHCYAERARDNISVFDIKNLIATDSKFPIPLLKCNLSFVDSSKRRLTLELIPKLKPFMTSAFDLSKDPITGKMGLIQLRSYFVRCGAPEDSPHVSDHRLGKIIRGFASKDNSSLLTLQNFELIYVLSLLNQSIFVWSDFLAFQYDFCLNLAEKKILWNIKCHDYLLQLRGYRYLHHVDELHN